MGCVAGLSTGLSTPFRECSDKPGKPGQKNFFEASTTPNLFMFQLNKAE